MDARTTLAPVHDVPDILRRLLADGHSTVAGRLAGAFRGMGRTRMASDIVKGVRAAGYTVRESDPFAVSAPVLETGREDSPGVHCIRLMWETMRGAILGRFPRAPGRPEDVSAYLERIEDVYVTVEEGIDYYHIEAGEKTAPAFVAALERAYGHAARIS